MVAERLVYFNNKQKNVMSSFLLPVIYFSLTSTRLSLSLLRVFVKAISPHMHGLINGNMKRKKKKSLLYVKTDTSSLLETGYFYPLQIHTLNS